MQCVCTCTCTCTCTCSICSIAVYAVYAVYVQYTAVFAVYAVDAVYAVYAVYLHGQRDLVRVEMAVDGVDGGGEAREDPRIGEEVKAERWRAW